MMTLLAAADTTGLFSLKGAFTLSALASLVMLVLLQIGLSFDNVAFMGLEINKLPVSQRGLANKYGMAISAALNIALLGFSGLLLSALTSPLVTIGAHAITGKDILLFGGGLFLLWHGGKELYTSVEKPHEEHHHKVGGAATFSAVMRSIFVINIVFSMDSVLTAVGTAKNFWIMAVAMVLSVVLMARFSMFVINFLAKHLSLKLLTISFLFLIGSNLCAEAWHQEMNKAFVYGPALFALALMLLTIRAESNRAKFQAAQAGIKN